MQMNICRSESERVNKRERERDDEELNHRDLFGWKCKFMEMCSFQANDSNTLFPLKHTRIP